MNKSDLHDFLHPEEKYPEYTTYIRKLDDVISNIPIVPQFFRYYELITDRIISEEETFHEPYIQGIVGINTDYEEREGIHKQINELGKIQDEYENDLIELIGKEKFDLFNICLLDWYTPSVRDKSVNIKQLKKSISMYFENKTVYVDEQFDDTILPNFTKKEISVLLEIQQKYLDKIFKNDLFYDEENENFTEYALFRGLNVIDLNNLFLDPHKELKYLSSYSCSPEVAIGLANKGKDGIKVLLYDSIINFENRIIASSFLNKPFNQSTNQNEFLIIPNTTKRYMTSVGKVEDLNVYQIHYIHEPLNNNDLGFEDDANFPFDSVHEVREYLLQHEQFSFKYHENTIVIKKEFSYIIELINVNGEHTEFKYDSIYNLLEDRLLDEKSIKEHYCLSD